MPPKFGNYLFRNLKREDSGEPGATPSPAVTPPGSLNLDERLIALTEADFVSDEALVPALAWDQCPGRKVEVKLGDTEGLMSGRVTIQAGVLRRVAGPLVPPGVPDDLQLPISLKTVVLQIHPYLQQSNEGTLRPVGPDFDTPIAQVAREDEGFFKLETTAAAEKAGLDERPPGTGASSLAPPGFPLIREKPVPPPAGAAPESQAPSIPVTVARPQARTPRPAQTGEERSDPFAILPSVGPRPSSGQPSPPDLPPAPPKEISVGPAPPGVIIQPVASAPSSPPSPGLSGKPGRRIALERLQEIFMTDDLLDIPQVLRLVSRFPRVTLAFAVTRDGTVYGEAPALGGYAGLAGGLVDAARRFGRLATGTECQGITILSERPVSIIGTENLSLVLLHEGRALPPGMKERVGAIVQALSELLPPDSTEGGAPAS
ncbi:MAG: hypothetical protein JO015_18250 [Verrucomicrobia bacterium]|nr:hypothetical protein [Verrucomicrobiota bacterium]